MIAIANRKWRKIRKGMGEAKSSPKKRASDRQWPPRALGSAGGMTWRDSEILNKTIRDHSFTQIRKAADEYPFIMPLALSPSGIRAFKGRKLAVVGYWSWRRETGCDRDDGGGGTGSRGRGGAKVMAFSLRQYHFRVGQGEDDDADAEAELKLTEVKKSDAING